MIRRSRIGTGTAALAVAIALTLAGCSLTSHRGAGVPAPSPVPLLPPLPSTSRVPPPPPNLDAIPDAVPRAEPRAKLGNPPFYDVMGHRYVVLPSSDGFVERGVASWYGPDFHGVATSTGESYDMYGMTAAHKTLPLPCYARVTNLRNGRSIVVRVNDRGPFIGNRIIDLSYTAAAKLDMIRDGTALVEVRVLGPSSPAAGPDVRLASLNLPAPAERGAPAPSPISSARLTPPAPVATIPPATSQVTTALYLQAGAFAAEPNARRLVDRLRAAGLPNVAVAPRAGAARPLYRVRVGPVASVEDFDRLVGQLAALGIPDARLAPD